MKRFLATVILLLCLAITAFSQTQGTAMRSTNGMGFGTTTIGGKFIATNTASTNHIAGTLNVRSNIASQATIHGNAAGVSNAVDLVAGAGLTITPTGTRSFTLASTDVAFTNLPIQELWPSLNTFGNSITSGEAGLPGWVYTMKTNLNDATEILNFGGSGYFMNQIASVFLASGQTNVPYLLEGGYNNYTGDIAADKSNRLYFINVITTNTPSPKRFLYLQIPNDRMSSNSTFRYEWTTNINAAISDLYPSNYYAWWDWFKMQTNGSAQDDADFAAGVPPSSLMNADGIHPNTAGNLRIGTNMAGVWRNYLRSFQEPILTGDIPMLLKGLTNNSLNVKDLVVGNGPDFTYLEGPTSATLPTFGNIRMATTNGSIYWQGTNLHGGLAWYNPGTYLTTLGVVDGSFYVGHGSIINPVLNLGVSVLGNVGARNLLIAQGLELGETTTNKTYDIHPLTYGNYIPALTVSTYSPSAVLIPRLIFSTGADSLGTPGRSFIEFTNAIVTAYDGLIVDSGASGVPNIIEWHDQETPRGGIAANGVINGNAAGVSNAVDMIAGSCIVITTNANGRTFTIAVGNPTTNYIFWYTNTAASGSAYSPYTLTANGAGLTNLNPAGFSGDVLTNNRTIGTTNLANLVNNQNGVITTISSNLITTKYIGIGGVPAATDAIGISAASAGRLSITLQNTTAAANSSFYFQNNRGGYASYGGLLQGGTTYAGNHFGVGSADKTVLLADGASSSGMDIGTATAMPVTLGTDNSARVTILSGGNVGIGVVAPTNKLQVIGAIQSTTTMFADIVTATNGVLWQGGAQLTNIYTATATLDFGNVATIGCADLTITVTGAALGDVVDLGVPNASVVANSSYSAWVSATDTVTVRFCALISGDPASGVFRAEVHKWK